MPRPALEVADIFRDHGTAWRRANAGHVSLDQMKVMSAIERCRTVALGGHVARCEGCAHTVIAYNELPQPTLPEVPGRGGEGVAGRAGSRVAPGAILPHRLHAARPDRGHRVSEQGCHLRYPAQGIGRDDDHDRGRSKTPGRTDRHNLRVAHLGLGNNSSPARAHDRSGRRAIRGRHEVDRLSTDFTSWPSACCHGCSDAWSCRC